MSLAVFPVSGEDPISRRNLLQRERRVSTQSFHARIVSTSLSGVRQSVRNLQDKNTCEPSQFQFFRDGRMEVAIEGSNWVEMHLVARGLLILIVKSFHLGYFLYIKCPAFRNFAPLAVAGLMGLLLGSQVSPTWAEGGGPHREQLVPILGVTLETNPIGTVANLVLVFEERADRKGLIVHFTSEPGRFSRMAQTAVEQAIYRTARAAALSTDSWTVWLSVPYPRLVVYGESLSAMVGLVVIALAKGEFIPPDRVMTGIVTPDGFIAPVGAVPLKVLAANEAHMRRVVVPDEMDIADGDWETPFLVQVSPVRSVSEAYLALTDHPLLP